MSYIEKFKPFEVNNLKNQAIFWDRRKVYQILKHHDIKTPRHIIINRGDTIDNEKDFESFDCDEDERQTIEKIKIIKEEIQSKRVKRPKREKKNNREEARKFRIPSFR